MQGYSIVHSEEIKDRPEFEHMDLWPEYQHVPVYWPTWVR